MSIVNKNKKIFIIVAIVFLLIMLFIGIDITQKTTFPGSKGNLEERIPAQDTVQIERKNQRWEDSSLKLFPEILTDLSALKCIQLK